MSEDTENFRGKGKHENITEAKKNEKLQGYEATVRRKVECEERAFHIVNNLIYGSVEAHYLIDCAKFINRDNYGDIVEERAISSLCGYPLCEEELRSVSKQKYHISTRSNKVYDITERKNFCSNQCLKASKAFQLQIPESPIWARDFEPAHEFTLLPHKSVKGMIGTEVVGQAPWSHLRDELECLGEGDLKKSSSAEKREEKLESKKKANVKKSTPRHSSSVKSQNSLDVLSDEPCANVKDKNLGKDFKNLNIRETTLNIIDDFGLETHALSSVPESEKPKICSSRKEQEVKKVSSRLSPREKNCEENSGKQETKGDVSPLERLNMILAKKKNILSGMADIQEIASTNVTSIKPSESLISKMDRKSHSPISRHKNESTVLDSDRNVGSWQKSSTRDKNKSEDDRKFKAFGHQSYLQKVCGILQPWITENTKQYLKSSSSGEKSGISTFSDPKIQSGYMDLCRHLDLQEKSSTDVLGEVRDIKAKNETSKQQSVPDYQRLKEESEQFQIKVTEFITGKRVKDKQLAIAEKNAEDSDPVFLPTVDIYDQMMIRAKIVFDRLDKTIPEIMVPMGLTVDDVSTYLRELIYTFRLERDNIIFRPSEWTLVALVLLKMLALKVKAIESAFKKEMAINYLNILLKGIGQTHQDLHTEVNSLLHENDSLE